jgi:hypothetical protein
MTWETALQKNHPNQPSSNTHKAGSISQSLHHKRRKIKTLACCKRVGLAFLTCMEILTLSSCCQGVTFHREIFKIVYVATARTFFKKDAKEKDITKTRNNNNNNKLPGKDGGGHIWQLTQMQAC